MWALESQSDEEMRYCRCLEGLVWESAEELVEDELFFDYWFGHVRGVEFEDEEELEYMKMRCVGRCPF